jgi:hypothetical protein
MNFHHVAMDVCREAVARRYVAVIAGMIVFAQVGLLLALDLDVVEGVIKGSELFGKSLSGGNDKSVEEAMAPVLRAIVLAVFHLGTLFGIVATSDIAVRLLSPGRVELSLSLPIRRWELGVGIYLGVLVLAIAGMVFAVSGFALILFWKAEFVTIAPLVGAVAAALGFATVYSVMLLASVIIRSQALASGAGLSLYLISLITSDRLEVVSWFERGWPRDVAGVVVAPLPRLQTLVNKGWEVANGATEHGLELAGVAGGALMFAAVFVAAASTVIWYRDY